MIDPMGLTVSDADQSRWFYDGALATLGYKVLMEVPKEFSGSVVGHAPVAGAEDANTRADARRS